MKAVSVGSRKLGSEDSWVIWVGFVILSLGIFGWLPKPPAIARWSAVSQSFPGGWSTITSALVLLGLLLLLTIVVIGLTRAQKVGRYLAGFLAIFSLAFAASWVSKFATFQAWGLETVLWALFLGLLLGNVFRLPEWLKAGIQTELFIKIGLVLLGAEILFSTIVKGGAIGMVQAIVVVVAVWFAAFWIARRLGILPDFAGIMASAVSICGVSAAIAAGGAIKGNPKHVSYVISLVLLVAMPMLVAMPFVARWLGLPPQVAGAWIGGTIDTTGAVVAAGSLIDTAGTGMQVASLVKMAQNVLIGFAAFLLALWAALSAGKEPGDKPRLVEIWNRFPKFILGFVAASLLFSLLVEPLLGSKATSQILGVTKGYREWLFVLGFVSIGLQTRFKELLTVGRGKPALAFLAAQSVNIVFALLVVWLLWSGILFAAPIK